jgi:hypothetical protein
LLAAKLRYWASRFGLRFGLLEDGDVLAVRKRDVFTQNFLDQIGRKFYF